MYNLTFTNLKTTNIKTSNTQTKIKKPELFKWTFIEGKQYTNVPNELYGLQLQQNYTPANIIEDLNLMYVSHGLVKVVKNFHNA